MISLAVVIAISSLCFLLLMPIGYRTVALVLLMTVSVLAILFDILPVLLAATLSALIWNFFFIPPLYTFHIDNAEDLLMFLMYFIIALVNATLTFKIRNAEKRARDKEEREKTINLYDTLLNSLSHEMRTPLATIIGAIDTLKENNSNLTPANHSNLLNEIEVAGSRLNKHVDNLLNMSRIESGIIKLNKDWCDINEIIFSVIQKMGIRKNSHRIEFSENDTLPLFKLDSGLIDQIIYNLIDNAVQYTPANSTITLNVSLHFECLCLNISDNGKGFTGSGIVHAFDKFYRLPGTKTGGLGLGLSIVKGLVEAQSGTIELENLISGGAKFTIIIPSEITFIANLKNE